MKRFILAVALALGVGAAVAAGSALTGLDLGTAFRSVSDASTLKDETDYLNSTADDLKLGARCARVEVFDFDSGHFSYPAGAQPGTLSAVSARLKAAGFTVRSQGHTEDTDGTDDAFLATRGSLRLLGIVFGDRQDAGLEWCSLPAAVVRPPAPVPHLSPATPAPTPAPVGGGRLPAGSYHCFIAGQFNAKFDFGSIRVQGDDSYVSQENVRGRYGYQPGSGAVSWSAGLGPDFHPPLVSVYQPADQSIRITYQLDAANTQFMTCWLGR